MVAIVPLKNPRAHQFYAQRSAQDGWSVRELHHQVERKAFERTELAALQVPAPNSNTKPALVFQDPYFLDFLGLCQGHDEADLESAILRQLEAFILGVWAAEAEYRFRF
jgi:predicted nuclease of restriction endonuclease-like (RecB) superfamily